MNSLTNLLNPPVNTWLRALSHGLVELPDGIRIIRFSDGNTLTWDRASGQREAKRRLTAGEDD